MQFHFRLRRFLTGFLALVVFGWCSPAAMAQADPPGRVGHLNYQAGSVTFSPAGDNEWVDAQPNRPLLRGDRLWTERGARAEIQIGSSAVRLDGQTQTARIETAAHPTAAAPAKGARYGQAPAAQRERQQKAARIEVAQREQRVRREQQAQRAEATRRQAQVRHDEQLRLAARSRRNEQLQQLARAQRVEQARRAADQEARTLREQRLGREAQARREADERDRAERQREAAAAQQRREQQAREDQQRQDRARNRPDLRNPPGRGAQEVWQRGIPILNLAPTS